MMDLQRIVWLASFPKSGNTWMRLLLAHYFLPKGEVDINSIHRFTTADVRQDFFDRAAGRPFKAKDIEDWLAMRAKVLPAIAASKQGHHFVKTHSLVGQMGPYHLIMPEVTAAAIFMIRNPFDVLPSYARHLSCDIDTALDWMLDRDHLNATPTGIAEVIGRWDEHAISWVDAPGLPIHVTRYEDMLADTEAEMRKVFAFLRLPVQDGQLRRAIRAASFKSLQKEERQKGFKERPTGMQTFFTTGTSGGWRDVLTPKQVGRVHDAFGSALERFYPELVSETADFAAGVA